MTTRNKNRLIFLLIGVISGMLLTAGGGLYLFQFIRKNTEFSRKFVPDKIVQKVSTEPLDHRLDSLGPPPDGNNFLVKVASSLDRIFQDGKTLLNPVLSDKADLKAAGHEYEAFQVVVRSGQSPVRGIRFEISDLLSTDGEDFISKENITWRKVGYVPTIKPYYPVKYVGNWPDPLMPETDVDVGAGTTQPFWFSVYVPPDTPAGNYRGAIKLITDGAEPRSIPVSLEVFDFRMPKERSLKTAFDFYGHETHTRYPRLKDETNEAYKARIEHLNNEFIVQMLKYRVDPVLNVNPANDYEMARVDRYRWFGMSNFSIGKRGGTLGNNWPYEDEELEALVPVYRRYGEILALNKWLKYTYIYTWDEGKIGNPHVKKVTNMIHRAHPGLKNMVAYHGFWDPEEHPGWGDDIDIWCFQISNFNERKMRKLQDIGMEIWMYISGPSGDGTPNLAMDFDSMDYRIVPWMCWRYDWKGFLYWCVNWWVNRDPFKTANNTKWAQNGNGLLFYPGEDGPIASLRFEIFRDGMEDYEYMAILKALVNKFRSEGLQKEHGRLIKDAEKLLSLKEDIVMETRSFTKDKQKLTERREKIARKIVEMKDILFAGGVLSNNVEQ